MASTTYRLSNWRTDEGTNPIGIYYKNKWLYAKLRGENLTDCTVDKVTVNFPALRCTFQPAGELRIRYGGATITRAIGSSGGATVERTYNLTGAKDTMFKDGTGEVAIRAVQSGDGYMSIDDADVTITVQYTPKTSLLQVPDKTVRAGGTLAFSISPFSSAYTHRATLTMGERTASLDMDAGVTEGSIPVPLEWLDVMPNSTTYDQGTLLLETLKGDAVLGSKTITGITLTLPERGTRDFFSISPRAGNVTTENMFTVDGVAYPDLGIGLVQGKSGLRVTLSGASGKYGATVVSTELWVGDRYASGEAGVTLETGLLLAPSVSMHMRVVDSRGIESIAYPRVLIDAHPYSPPTASLEAYRTDEMGDRDDRGLRGVYACSYTHSPLDGANQCTVTLSVSGVAVSDPPESGFLLPGNTMLFDALRGYDVTLTVQDAYETVVRTVRIPSTAMAMHFNADGDGVAFGQTAQRSKAVEVSPEWDLYAGGAPISGCTVLASDLSWTSGDLEVPGIDKWRVVLVRSGVGYMVCVVTDGLVQGGGFNVTASIHRSLGFRASVAGSTLTLVTAHYINHEAGASHGARTALTINGIYGLIRREE